MALVVKNLPANAGGVRDAGSFPGLGRSPGGGRGNPLQYSYLEIPWMSMESPREGHGRVTFTFMSSTSLIHLHLKYSLVPYSCPIFLKNIYI